ncbi:MAG: N-formylglutamate amidohydrolase [Allosphingosinicella sp.]
MAEPKLPFRRLGPRAPASPVVLSVPHAGRRYGDALLNASRLPRPKLEALEDRLVDRLVWRAVADGATAIVAEAPRAEIDLNRDETELDPALVVPRPHPSLVTESARTRGGLGLVPARIAGAGAIWRQLIPAEEIARRIEAVYRPYHAALEEALAAARDRFGVAVLLDCHSMPPRAAPAREPPVVLGDRYGTSLAPALIDAAEAAVRRAGLAVARNAPYAGGEITRRHGRPAEGFHALQVELDRSLYLAADLRAPGPGFDRIAGLLADIVRALASAALEPPVAIAAE